MGRLGWAIICGCILGVILFGILQRGCSATAERGEGGRADVPPSAPGGSGAVASPESRPPTDALGREKPRDYERRPGPPAMTVLERDALVQAARNKPGAGPKMIDSGTIARINNPRPVVPAPPSLSPSGRPSPAQINAAGMSRGASRSGGGASSVMGAPAAQVGASDTGLPGFQQVSPGVYAALPVGPTGVRLPSGPVSLDSLVGPNSPSAGGSGLGGGNGLTTVTGSGGRGGTAASGLGRFALTAPALSATGVSTAPAFAWEASANAAAYRLRVSTSSTFATTVIDQSNITQTSFTPASGALAAGTAYFWQVTAANSAGSLDASAPGSFTTAAATNPNPNPNPNPGPGGGGPTQPPGPGVSAPGEFSLQTPAPNARGLTGPVSLLWGASSGAATYTVEIFSDAALTARVLQATGLTTAFLVVPEHFFANGATYFWRVTAVNSAGSRASSGSASAFTRLGAPGVFDLLTPQDLATDAAMPIVFSWSPSLDAASYQVEVATDAAFSVRVINRAVATASLVATAADGLAPGKRYFWRVTASNAIDVRASSTTRQFSTAQGPADFALVGPAAGASACLPITLTWETSDRALAYRVEVSTTAAFATTVVNQLVVPLLSGTSYRMPDGLLQVGRTYFWRVTASNVNGDTPALASPSSFAVTPPNFDVNGDGIVDVRDMYAFETAASKPDLTCDGLRDDADRVALRDAVRSGEASVVGGSSARRR